MPIIARSDMYKLYVDYHIDDDTYHHFNQLAVCTQCCEDYDLDSDMYPDEEITASHCPVCGKRLLKKEKE